MAPFPRLARSATVAVLAVSVAACGADTNGTGVTDTSNARGAPTDATSAETSVPLSDTDLPTMSGRPQRPAKEPTDAFSPITLRGEIAAGLAEGCIELMTAAGRYALLGDVVSDVAPGDQVEVVGLPAPQLVVACDGTPLAVSEIRRL